MPITNNILGTLNMVVYEDYEGPYSVEPSFSDQILETLNKKAHANIAVNEMPDVYCDVLRDGDTLYIL